MNPCHSCWWERVFGISRPSIYLAGGYHLVLVVASYGDQHFLSLGLSFDSNGIQQRSKYIEMIQKILLKDSAITARHWAVPTSEG